MSHDSSNNRASDHPPSHHGPLLELSTRTLLEKFGSGGHKPGSGSAAALSTLLACKMLRTVVALTCAKNDYEPVHAQLSLANQSVLDPIEPQLADIVQDDAIQFDKVIRARRARNAAREANERRQLREQALAELKIATELPLRLADYSLKIADTACVVFDLGFKSARGDSAVAISAALSGAYGALSIVYLNLQSFKTGDWAVSTRARADELMQRTHFMQQRFVERISRLRMQTQESMPLPSDPNGRGTSDADSPQLLLFDAR